MPFAATIAIMRQHVQCVASNDDGNADLEEGEASVSNKAREKQRGTRAPALKEAGSCNGEGMIVYKFGVYMCDIAL